MSDVTLGQLIEGEAQRDAFHIAVAPVVAAHAMIPGQHVGLLPDGRASAKSVDKTIGIVDPFLLEAVGMGQRFWLCLYQKTVTGMRHEWTHPAFSTEQPTPTEREAEARKVIEAFASRLRRSYDYVLDTLSTALTDGGAHGGDDDDADSFNSNKKELLLAASIILGKPLRDAEEVYFSCAC